MPPEAAISLTVLILWVLIAFIPAKIASDRGLAGGPLLWWFAGLLLSVIAILVALITKPDPKILEARAVGSGGQKKCPQCAELVKAEALKCRFCSFEFEAEASAPTPPKSAESSTGLVACPSCRRQIPRSLTRCTFCRAEIRAG